MAQAARIAAVGFGLMAFVLLFSEDRNTVDASGNGGAMVGTLTGLLAFVFCAACCAFFSWASWRLGKEQHDYSPEPDPDTPMDMPWDESRAA